MQKLNKNFTKLSEVEIEEPKKEEIIKGFNRIKKELLEANSGEETNKAIKKFFSYCDNVRSIFILIQIRYTMNTKDEKYSKLRNLLDEIDPEIEKANKEVLEVILSHKYKKDIIAQYGELLFKEYELSKKTFSPEIIEDLVEENKLCSEYVELLSSALIEYKGEKYTLSQMGKFSESKDRKERKEANELKWKFFADNDAKLGQIYDSLVKVRTRIAKKLGYENFVQLGYDRMGRLDWNSKDAAEYREKIFKYIVPISKKIRAAQQARMGYEDGMKYYDLPLFYKSGNANPKGTIKDLIPIAQKMYSEMHKITAKYFNFMVEHGCLDLEARPNKAGGGYMEYIPALQTSFIFSNANGTSGDVETLTHEFGHSLQGFLGAKQVVPEYRAPGYECCEMHSMSMEFLTYPWMENFFGDKTEKFKYFHISEAINFIPYGSIVDDFQTYVYEHPELTHKQRKAYWRKIEKKFLPYKKYDNNEFLEKGGFWMCQHHIYESPFYYLDYTIAQVVALQFYIESIKKWRKTFKKYINLDLLAGTLPFRELLKAADIQNPFDGDNIKVVASKINRILKKYNPIELDK